MGHFAVFFLCCLAGTHRTIALAMFGLLALCATLCLAQAAVDSDLVSSLPGIIFTPKFKSYSGYLNASDTKMLHYWFVESQNNPAKDPLVLWLNGGPGCSSLNGLLSENGPFRVDVEGKSLFENKYAWNKIANVLYLESPAGVGFSFATDNNYTSGDDETAMDNYMAIKYFLKNFPEYAKNDFYITGESYGGIYVPTLALHVMQDSQINFKGMAVGNGESDVNVNQDSLLYFGYYHGLYSQQHWDKLVALCCNGTEKRCTFTENGLPPKMLECLKMTMETLNIIEQLNVHNLYEECYPTKVPPGLPQLYYFIQPTHAQLLKDGYPHPVSPVYPQCADIYGITTYLNRSDVRKALHIPDSAPEWNVCSMLHYRLEYLNMTAQYKTLLAKNKYRIMLYNGDVDMACNFLGEEWFIDALGLKEKSAWRSWMYTELDNTTQVAGFVHEYQGLTFVTVKDSGHMVPQDKPIQAYEMFQKFITNQPF